MEINYQISKWKREKMENKYDISIIVPFYHGNDYIDKLLKNLNSCANYAKKLKVEIVIVNDSPGCQVEYLDYSNLDIKVVVNIKNMGIHYSRVVGINNAQGKYIIMLDQDDELNKKALLLQYDAIRDNDLVIANGMDYNPLNYGEIYHSKKHQELSANLDYYLNIGCMIVSPGQCMIKKSIIPKLWLQHPIKNNGADDMMLWLMLLKENIKITFNYENIYVHNFSGVNVSSDFEKMVISTKEIVDFLNVQDILTELERKKIYKRLKMRSIYENKGKIRKIIAMLLYPRNALWLIKLKIV